MKLTPNVSIIIPVYKAEATLARCIDSILAQSFPDFECILVNDGSPDRCPAICDDYAAHDPRIRVIHQHNMGASAARNAGLDSACGKYIMFCDSDDVVAVDWVKHLYEAVSSETICPMCGYCKEADQLGCEQSRTILPGKAYPLSEYYRFNELGLAGFVWNSIFLRSILEQENIRFRDKREEGNYNEDLLFALTYIRHMDALIYVGYSDYYYSTQENSLSRSWDQFYFRKYEEKHRLWQAFLEEYRPSNAETMESLANTTLYHTFLSLNQAFIGKDYSSFRQIVQCQTVHRCAQTAQHSQENPVLLKMLRNNQPLLLWMFYQLQKWKKRIRKNSI